jgi:hypothetical protein
VETGVVVPDGREAGEFREEDIVGVKLNIVEG